MKHTNFSKKLSILLIFSFLINYSFSQEKKYKVQCLAFYNLENWFDTIDSPDTKDTEFTPNGSSKWNAEKYYHKLGNIGKVFSELGTEMVKNGPSIIGMSEVENLQVLQEIVNYKTLKDRNYKIVHYDSPDRRGIDVAILYRPDQFVVTNSKSLKVIKPDDPGFFTRDILMVSGKLDGEQIHVFINHWPSRRGGEKRSRPLRNMAADVARTAIDSILHNEPNAKIILMGDLNDNTNNESVVKHIKAKKDKNNLKSGEMFNTMAQRYDRGIGTTAYRDSWSLFDQIIISQGLLGDDKSNYKFYKSEIFKKNYMMQKEGRFKGYPFRTYAGGVFMGGFSDHFPVYMFLVKEIKN